MNTQLDALDVEEVSKAKFWVKRVRKLSLRALLLSFFSLLTLNKSVSLSLWAEKISFLTGELLSKTAVWKKVNEPLLLCLKDLLSRHIQKVEQNYLKAMQCEHLFSSFKKVLLQDSTIFSLPDELHLDYKGQSKSGEPKSKLRLQLIYDFVQGCFIDTTLQGYCDNDQKDSSRILQFAEKGDLVIRDLGYFALKVFKQLANKEAYFVSRYKLNVNLYELDGERLNLLSLFAKADKCGQKVIDLSILAGSEEKLPTRLVAIRLPEDVAAERKRKAMANRDKRMNPSDEYLKKLEWNIFLTNVSTQIYTPKQIAQVYRLRWHIEIIFKGWKSHFNFKAILPDAPQKKEINVQRLKLRVEICMYLILLYASLFIVGIYSYFGYRIFTEQGRLLSYLKTCQFVNVNFDSILYADTLYIQEMLSYYACYEKRKKRQNTLQRCLSETYEYEDFNH